MDPFEADAIEQDPELAWLPDIALSVRQPWAWAIIHARKDIENRSAMSVKHGMKPGRIAVHAAKGMTRDEYEDAAYFMRTEFGLSVPRPDALVRGAIIGAVTVTDIVKAHASPWFFGPRGLVLADPRACAPKPYPGALGYFHWRDAYMTGDISLPSVPDEAKPWMVAWPSSPVRRKPAPETGTLL